MKLKHPSSSFHRTDCRWFLHFSNTPRTKLEKIFACEYTKRISLQMHSVLIVSLKQLIKVQGTL